MALNAELKKDMMALNAKPKMNNGSECQTQDATLIANLKICRSECQTETITLAVKLKT